MAKKKSTRRSVAKSAAPSAPPPPTQPGAYFLSVSLENFRCFGPKQTLDLTTKDGKPARWTVIVGENGTGKTTLLQAIVGMEYINTYSEESHEKSMLRILELYSNGDLFNGFRDSSKNDPYWIHAELTHSLEDNVSKSNSFLSRKLQIREISPGMIRYIDRSSPWSKTNPFCCGYGASRRYQKDASNSSESDPTSTIFDVHADLQDPCLSIINLDYQRHAVQNSDAGRKADRDYKAITEVLQQSLPGVRRIYTDASRGRTAQYQLIFDTDYGSVPFAGLGFGYRATVTWVTDFANNMFRKYHEVSDEPFAEPAVLVIDEIDLHLHPRWQRLLIENLTKCFPNTQFIVTAHSPLIVQAAADANLALLRRAGDHIEIVNDVDEIRNWRVDQILTSELFGLSSARPPHLEALLAEQMRIQTKSRLTSSDKDRLVQLEREIGPLPLGETPAEISEREEFRALLLELRAKAGRP